MVATTTTAIKAAAPNAEPTITPTRLSFSPENTMNVFVRETLLVSVSSLSFEMVTRRAQKQYKKRSDDSRSSADDKNRVSYVPYIHTSHTKHTVLDRFNVCSNHAPLN